VSGETDRKSTCDLFGRPPVLRLVDQLQALDQQIFVAPEIDGGTPTIPTPGAAGGVEGRSVKAKDHHGLHARPCSPLWD
jgi:hypothetical protein